LEEPQELRLHRQRHVTDLVEEQRAPLRELDPPRLVLERPRERAPHVPEELALQELGGQRRAVDRVEGPRRSAAVRVDGPRHKFLAGAALSLDEDRRVILADGPHQNGHALHGL